MKTLKSYVSIFLIAGTLPLAAITSYAAICPPNTTEKAGKTLGCVNYLPIKALAGSAQVDAILANPEMLADLKAFVEKEFSGENLAFLTDARTDKKTIYNTYIGAEAKKQINLPAAVKDALAANAKPNQWDRMDFTAAKAEIKKLMASDTLKRFLAAR